MQTTTKGQSPESSILNIAQIDCLPVTSAQVQQVTQVDPVLNKVLNYTKWGWPASVPEVLKPFQNRYTELTVEGECLMWSTRVIVPKKLQGSVLYELHSNHPGISCMKSLATSYAWWPEMDGCIEDLVKGYSISEQQGCTSCGPSAPLGLAYQTMGKNPCGLFGPLSGEDIFQHGGCQL